MSRGNFKISPAEVDFWLDADKYSNFIEDGLDFINKPLVFNIDMVKLSSIRSSISNFVRILTRKPIPVYFHNRQNNSFNINGNSIYISAKITNKKEFDAAVGLALHEGAHTLLTDFDVAKSIWAHIPHQILKLSDNKNIRRESLERFIYDMWNVIEDRYIDTYVFNEAPGYRGYYAALYDLYWNSPEVDYYLQSENFRYPSLKSYDYRITNFTNETTDLLALPCLDDIARIIDISHIDRLIHTKDRVETAFNVTEIVLDCIDKQEKIEKQFGGTKQKKKDSGLADPNDYFDFGGDAQEKTEESDSVDVDVGKKMVEEISDVMSGRNSTIGIPRENDKAVRQISEDPIDKESEKEIEKLVEKQRKFLLGDVSKESVTDYQKALLDLIEKHGIMLVRVELPVVMSGNDSSLKVDCVVVQKMTKELVLAGQGVFPLCGVMKMGDTVPEPPKDVADAVSKGISLGTKLGRKLQIRAEVHPIKTIRKRDGKINKRQLHEASFDADDLFYKINIEKHHDANLHITVDASNSMSGIKWEKTMTAVVAICKAASMINNIHITVSFRTTQVSGYTELPYVVMAYDSKIDKFSKVKTLFPYLTPSGCTPEGLAFGAIMNLFKEITPDEEDRFFLNLSDGEPYYMLRAPETEMIVVYRDDLGTIHTKAQIDKIRKHGVQILSYYIGSEEQQEQDGTRKNFRKMYGHSAKFITVDEITGLAKTLNELFLKNINEK